MSRHDEPNASHFSARYAERKRAGERARDAQPRKDAPCLRCGVPVPFKDMKTMCGVCLSEYMRICTEQGISAATDWQRNGPYGKAVRG